MGISQHLPTAGPEEGALPPLIEIRYLIHLGFLDPKDLLQATTHLHGLPSEVTSIPICQEEILVSLVLIQENNEA